MNIEQNIIDAVSIGRQTDIPVLFMSNPGLGKTTILKRYAENNGLFLQTLIGSRYSPEEISGYQVNNGGTSLTHMNPSWYTEILAKKKAGIPTLLFIDELSTCNESVQGVLLTLIFDRTIGYGKFLPDDCVIVAAANYSANLSPYMNILSPTLNRFMVINLNDGYTGLNLADEFLLPPQNQTYHTYRPLTPEDKDLYLKRFHDFWRTVFVKYSDKQSSYGIIDISNPEIGNLYTDSGNHICNFISGRSLSYLQKAILAYMELGIKNTPLLNMVIDGLVGAGSCNFTSQKQKDAYRDHLHKSLATMASNKTSEKVQMDILTGKISKDISNFLMNRENLNMHPEEELKTLVAITAEVKENFTPDKLMLLTSTEEGKSSFVSDMDSIAELVNYLVLYPDTKLMAIELQNLVLSYYSIYCKITGVKPNINKLFGNTNSLFEGMIILRQQLNVTSHNKKTVYLKCAVRKRKMSVPTFYIVERNESYFNTKLAAQVTYPEKYEVLVWKSGRMTFVSMDSYTKECA